MEKWVLSFCGEGGSLEWMYLMLLKGDFKVGCYRTGFWLSTLTYSVIILLLLFLLWKDMVWFVLNWQLNNSSTCMIAIFSSRCVSSNDIMISPSFYWDSEHLRFQDVNKKIILIVVVQLSKCLVISHNIRVVQADWWMLLMLDFFCGSWCWKEEILVNVKSNAFYMIEIYWKDKY